MHRDSCIDRQCRGVRICSLLRFCGFGFFWCDFFSIELLVCLKCMWSVLLIVLRLRSGFYLLHFVEADVCVVSNCFSNFGFELLPNRLWYFLNQLKYSVPVNLMKKFRVEDVCW